MAGLSNSLQNSTYIRSGDESIPRQAIKLAEIRKIAEAAVNAKIGSGGMSPEAAKYAQSVIDEIKQTIPFTVNDVVEAVTKVRKETGKDVLTMGETTKGFSLDNLFGEKQKPKGKTGPQEGDTSTSKSGKPIIYRNGKWEYQDASTQ